MFSLDFAPRHKYDFNGGKRGKEYHIINYISINIFIQQEKDE